MCLFSSACHCLCVLPPLVQAIDRAVVDSGEEALASAHFQVQGVVCRSLRATLTLRSNVQPVQRGWYIRSCSWVDIVWQLGHWSCVDCVVGSPRGVVLLLQHSCIWILHGWRFVFVCAASSVSNDC